VPTDGSVVDIAGFGSAPLVVQALCANGDLYAWGFSDQGQVGTGSAGKFSTPALITTGVTKLFSDGMTSHNYGYIVQSFFQKDDGLYMSGANNADGYYTGMGVTVTSDVLTPAKVLLPGDDNQVVDMGHFTTHSHGRVLLALTTKGNIYTWGVNTYNSIHTDNTNPVPVPQLITIPKDNS